jgi:hypothetical protein
MISPILQSTEHGIRYPNDQLQAKLILGLLAIAAVVFVVLMILALRLT